MIKRPVLTSLLIAVVISLALVGYMLAQSRTVDEQPFILFFGLLALPFAWFFVWIFLATIAWWQGVTAEPPPDDDPGRAR